MATKTFEELKQLAIQIRDEKTNKQNTATRVGTAMLEHINKLEQDYYDKTQTDEELKEQNEKLTGLSDNVGLYNVDKNVPLGSGFYTSTTARAAVPTSVRKLGLIITYKTDETTSITEQFIGSDVSGWATDTNWKNVGSEGGNKILEWKSDAATTRKQVPQKERKAGIQISYKPDGEDWVNEQYVGESFTDTEWAKDENWESFAKQYEVKKILDYTDDLKLTRKKFGFIDSTGDYNTTNTSGTFFILDYYQKAGVIKKIKCTPGGSHFRVSIVKIIDETNYEFVKDIPVRFQEFKVYQELEFEECAIDVNEVLVFTGISVKVYKPDDANGVDFGAINNLSDKGTYSKNSYIAEVYYEVEYEPMEVLTNKITQLNSKFNELAYNKGTLGIIDETANILEEKLVAYSIQNIVLIDSYITAIRGAVEIFSYAIINVISATKFEYVTDFTEVTGSLVDDKYYEYKPDSPIKLKAGQTIIIKRYKYRYISSSQNTQYIFNTTNIVSGTGVQNSNLSSTIISLQLVFETLLEKLENKIEELIHKTSSMPLNMEMPDMDYRGVIHAICYGQSLALGSTTSAIEYNYLSDKALMFKFLGTYDRGFSQGITKEEYEQNKEKYDNEMYQIRRAKQLSDIGSLDTSWSALTSVTGEPPCYGFFEGFFKSYTIHRNKQDIPFYILLTNSAVGGASISTLMNKEAYSYKNIISDVTKAKEIFTKKGLNYKVGCIYWLQGESDAGETVEWYLDKLKELSSNLNKDIKAITGQSDDIVFITYQTGSAISWITSSRSAQAQFEASIENNIPKIIMATPCYNYKKSDNVHLVSNASRAIGNAMGDIYYQYLSDSDTDALHVVSYNVVDNDIFLEMNKEVCIDKDNVRDTLIKNKISDSTLGFYVEGKSTSNNIIESVRINADNEHELVLHCSEPPSGTLYYGTNSTDEIVGGAIREKREIYTSQKGYSYRYMPIQKIDMKESLLDIVD